MKSIAGLGFGITLANNPAAARMHLRRARQEEKLRNEEGYVVALQVRLPPDSPRKLGETELNGLFASCMPRLARSARQMVRNPQDSEDILQESLLSAFQKLHQFRGRAKFSTWMYSIMRNTAKMHLRKLASCRLCSIEFDDLGDRLTLENTSDPGLSAEETYAHNERSQILQGKLNELPAAYQSAIQLCDIEGLDQRDAAARLGVKISSLKTRLHRARRLISKKIRASYVA